MSDYTNEQWFSFLCSEGKKDCQLNKCKKKENLKNKNLSHEFTLDNLSLKFSKIKYSKTACYFNSILGTLLI